MYCSQLSVNTDYYYDQKKSNRKILVKCSRGSVKNSRVVFSIPFIDNML